MFVNIRSKRVFFATKPLSRQAYFCGDKRHVFFAINTCYSSQNYASCDKIMLARQIRIVIKVFSRQKFCRDKHTFVASKDVVCRDKHVSRDKTFVATKMILWQLPPMIVSCLSLFAVMPSAGPSAGRLPARLCLLLHVVLRRWGWFFFFFFFLFARKKSVYVMISVRPLSWSSVTSSWMWVAEFWDTEISVILGTYRALLTASSTWKFSSDRNEMGAYSHVRVFSLSATKTAMPSSLTVAISRTLFRQDLSNWRNSRVCALVTSPGDCSAPYYGVVEIELAAVCWAVW